MPTAMQPRTPVRQRAVSVALASLALALLSACGTQADDQPAAEPGDPSTAAGSEPVPHASEDPTEHTEHAEAASVDGHTGTDPSDAEPAGSTDAADDTDADEPVDAPAPITIRHRTMPDWSLNTQFGWGAYGYPEVGQLLRIDEPFELTHVEFAVHAPTLLLDGFFAADLDWNARGEFVTNPDRMRDLPATARFTAFRGTTDIGGERIGLEELSLVSQQTLPGPMHGDGERQRYELPEPIALTAGPWLLAFQLIAEDPAILDLPFTGRESGDRSEQNPDTAGDCDYTRSEDLYPEGSVYARGWADHASFPTPWSDPAVFELPLDDAFVLHEAKVSECIAIGTFGDDLPMNPGDIDLVLHGRDLP